MRTSCFFVALSLLFVSTFTYADDLSTVVHSCGEPSDAITSKNAGRFGLYDRTVSYKSSDGTWLNVMFTSRSKRGPWRWDHAWTLDYKDVAKFPCLTSYRVEAIRGTPDVSNPSKVNRPALGDATTLILLWVVGGIVGLFVYFVPTLVAMKRKCKSFSGICVVNIFLGWTFLGWVVALAWAASGEQHHKPANVSVSG
jgi:hypothetical protein